MRVRNKIKMTYNFAIFIKKDIYHILGIIVLF